MSIWLSFAATISSVAAVGAWAFAWLTLREGRAARREDDYERELDRLYHLLELAGNVAAVGASGKWSAELGVAQLRLDATIAGRPHLASCRELVGVDADEVFETYLEARDELTAEVERHLAANPRSKAPLQA